MTNPLDTIGRWKPPGDGPLPPRPQKRAKAEKAKRESISPRFKLWVRERDSNLCVLCKTPGSPSDPLVIDHIDPVSQGGRTEESNLCTLHRSCNAAKGARRLDIMRAIGHAVRPGVHWWKCQHCGATHEKATDGEPRRGCPSCGDKGVKSYRGFGAAPETRADLESRRAHLPESDRIVERLAKAVGKRKVRP